MRRVVVSVSVIALLGSVAAWAASDAAAEFARGQALLAKADFEGALEAFKAATKAEPEISEFFQEYTLLRRVINIRAQLKEEEDADTWQTMARALYNYYRQHKIRGEALTIAKALHAKAPSGESAAILAEAQLTAGDHAAAAGLLTGLDTAERTPQTDILHGIALAHLDKAAEAKAIAGKLELPKDCDGPMCVDAARLYALVGDTDKALGLLKCALECTPPNQLDAVKAEAKECPDLAKLAAAPTFAEVMETKSKMPAGCGSAAGCGKCPSKTGCAEKDKEKEGAAGCPHEKQGDKPPTCEHEKK